MPPVYRQIYNIFGLYAADAPSYSGHWSNYNGEKLNILDNPSIFDENLLKQIERVQSVNYDINIQRTPVAQLGTRGLVNRFIVNRPSINLNFDYFLAGIRNEARLGFVVNYPDITGLPILDHEICALDNFTGQSTDVRNIFIAINTGDSDDINSRIYDVVHTGQSNQIVPQNLFVYGFGNCYVNSYKVNAAVGQIPIANLSYVCDNIVGYASGSGCNIPAVDFKSGNLISGVKFTIPRSESVTDPSVLRPGDITLKLGYFSGYTGIFNETTEALFGANNLGLPIQSFDLSINLEREELKSIGYVLPVDRRINFPILAELNFSSIIDNNMSGNLVNIINKNQSYDILINMLNPGCGTSNRDIGYQIKLKDNKLERINYGVSIGNKLMANFGFIAEIDCNNNTKGLFMSGLLNTPFPQFPFDFLVLEQNRSGFLYTEDNNLIIVNERPIV